MTNIGKETEQIEFKKTTGEMKAAIISIASILNKHGSGELYFGVKNNGDVIGQEISDSTLRDVSRAVSDHIKPTIYPEIAEKNIGDKTVVYVKFEGNRAPYLAYNVSRVRVADEDRVMDQDMYDDLLRRRTDFTKAWEMQLSDFIVDDIDADTLKKYLNKAKEVGRITFDSSDPYDVLEKLELRSGDRLLNAGAALFCEKGINELQMAKYNTNRKSNFADIRRYSGSILTLADRAEEYIIDAMDWKAEIVGLTREETPEIPVKSVREAIINAFAHRIIESRQSVEIAVYRDRIEIFSPGVYASTVNPETYILEERRAVRRNPLITKTLYYSKDMETFATGFRRIKEECDEAGCKVGFEKQENGFVVVFYRNLRHEWSIGTEQRANGANRGANQNKDYGNDTDLSIMILDEIRTDPKISQRNLAQKLGESRRRIQRVMGLMIDAGQIRHVGSTRGHWEIL